MDMFYRIVSLLGGLALFLYGMRTMGDGLKNCSGNAMRIALKKVTDRPIKGFILGLLITCVIQSSTACIVLTVGLVGAGFLTFRQSVGVVLGAEVGTTITAQIIRLMDLSAGTGSILYFFKSDNLAPMALIVGIILIMFVKGNRANNTGSILMGFGILFMGLIFMSQSVSTLGDEISGLLTAFEGNYILNAGQFGRCAFLRCFRSYRRRQHRRLSDDLSGLPDRCQTKSDPDLPCAYYLHSHRSHPDLYDNRDSSRNRYHLRQPLERLPECRWRRQYAQPFPFDPGCDPVAVHQ